MNSSVIFFKEYLFIFGYAGSSWLCSGSLQLRWASATLPSGPRARYLWRTSLVAPQHVESSRTRDGTHVPCIDRRVSIHSATREVQSSEINPISSPSPLLGGWGMGSVIALALSSPFGKLIHRNGIYFGLCILPGTLACWCVPPSVIWVGFSPHSSSSGWWRFGKAHRSFCLVRLHDTFTISYSQPSVNSW